MKSELEGLGGVRVGPDHFQMCGFLAFQGTGSSTLRVHHVRMEDEDRERVTFSGT